MPQRLGSQGTCGGGGGGFFICRGLNLHYTEIIHVLTGSKIYLICILIGKYLQTFVLDCKMYYYICIFGWWCTHKNWFTLHVNLFCKLCYLVVTGPCHLTSLDQNNSFLHKSIWYWRLISPGSDYDLFGDLRQMKLCPSLQTEPFSNSPTPVLTGALDMISNKRPLF